MLQKKKELELKQEQKKQRKIGNQSERSESIDVHLKVQNLNDMRKEPMFELFADHFLKLAESSIKFRSYPQAYMYVLMTLNIADMIEDFANNTTLASSFRKKANRLYQNSKSSVEEMLGSDWGRSDSYDIVTGRPRSTSSNWEYKTRELPKPPDSENSKSSNHISKSTTSSNINNIKDDKKVISKPDAFLTLKSLPSTSKTVSSNESFVNLRKQVDIAVIHTVHENKKKENNHKIKSILVNKTEHSTLSNNNEPKKENQIDKKGIINSNDSKNLKKDVVENLENQKEGVVNLGFGDDEYSTDL